MQIKLQRTVATGDDDVPGRDKLRREIAEFIDETNEAAIALYTISNVCMSLFGAGKLQRDISSKLMAISTALTLLSVLLDSKSEISLLYLHDLELLSKSIDTCRPLIHKITTSAESLDSHLVDEPRSEGVGAQAKFNAFNHGEAEGPLRTLDDCLRVLMGMIMTARAERLSHRDTLTDSESSEALRFHLALLHNEKFPESTQRGHFTPGNINTSPLSQSSPSYKHSPLYQPNPLCIQQPAFPPPQPQSPLFPHLGAPLSLQESTHTPPAATMDKFKAHMEAYILRPQVHSIDNSSIITYVIEPIHLEEGDMRAHVATQPSIIEAVAQLLPDQLRIIQEHVRKRKGELVSALFGADVDLVTQMGTFRTKSVIFIVKTRADNMDDGLEVKQEGKQYACWGAKVDTPAPTTFPSSFFGMPFAKTNASAPPPPAPALGFPTTAMDRDGSKSQVLGGPGFLKEKDGPVGPYMQEYMSISSLDVYKDESFEELRVADYKAGRTKDVGVKPALKPAFSFAEKTDSAKSLGLFGQKLGTVPGAAVPCFFSQSTSTPTPGLSSQTKSTPKPDSVGQPTSTPAPGLFAKLTPPTSAFTFGLKSAPVLGGLGDNSGTPLAFGGLSSPNRDSSVTELTKQLSTMDILRPATDLPSRSHQRAYEALQDLPIDESVKASNATMLERKEQAERKKHSERKYKAEQKEQAQRKDYVEREAEAERKQKMKAKDFDPNYESEEVWSARYERLEHYRTGDAKKPPKIPEIVYAVDKDGVAWVRPNPPPADLANSFAEMAPVASTNPFTALARVASDASTASAFHMFSTPVKDGAANVPGLGDGSKDGGAGEGDGKKNSGKEQEIVGEQTEKE
ncbi:hypothetical protein HBI65_045810 [Parastagonospora nodorum]|nr:hypothetical protein HBI51_101210 [Parastagonospora nodorum]KAH6102592.1 hypothetical protein HBI65_045810 [Parastagonospora nodorum]KAH6195502.1 hypothetical protein HBI53_184430 [Parastagonospora nodorum]KAH6425874.1 hypothetical protein HBI14_059800 [Parastagonospora nodorum]